MSATLSTTLRPAATKRAGIFLRLLGACCHAIADHLARRAALVSLRELDDRALRDIGLMRHQIEPAVRGYITLSDQTRMY